MREAKSVLFLKTERKSGYEWNFLGLAARRETTLCHVHHRLFLELRFLEANFYVTKYHHIPFLQFCIKIWQILYMIILVSILSWGQVLSWNGRRVILMETYSALRQDSNYSQERVLCWYIVTRFTKLLTFMYLYTCVALGPLTSIFLNRGKAGSKPPPGLTYFKLL